MTTLTFIILLSVSAIVGLLGVLLINFHKSTWTKQGWILFVIGAVASLGVAALMMDQGIDNSRDNCIHNLNGKVVGQSCIVGTDWKEISSF